jgi:hypothetical protein
MGKPSKGTTFFIRHATLMGYIQQAVCCHTGVPIDYVLIMTDAVRKYERVPDCREMIHDPMMSEIISRSQAATLDSLTAAL